ncbi:MAG: UbiA family prenyltransferase [Acidobacteria bacterium]|nr:UbiA family prenyltransferase [Acidobacteriota bacterium]
MPIGELSMTGRTDAGATAGGTRPLRAVAAAVRFGVWWRHLVPPIVGAIYFGAASARPAGRALVVDLALFLASVVGIAAFGYLLNDVADVASDARAGKPNRAAPWSRSGRALRVALWLGVGLAPWLALPRRPVALALLGAEVLLLAAYSLPPLRLKERGVAGTFADALYGHLLPVAIALATFLPADGAPAIPTAWALAATLAVALLAKGLRNILLHQIGDRARDRLAGSRTLVVAIGPVAALAWINRILLPTEVAALALLLGLLAPFAPLWIAGALFLLSTATEFSAWKFPFIPKRQLRLKFLWCLNDFWELWLPAALVVTLVARATSLWPLALAHLVLFPDLPVRLARHAATAAASVRDLVRHGVQ